MKRRRGTQPDRLAIAKALFLTASSMEDEGNIRRATKLYSRAARLGHAYSQNNLANLLDRQMKPAQEKKAVYWYKKAVKQGLELAAWNLAMHYRNIGNARWHRYWLRIAAKMGDEDAQNELKRLPAFKSKSKNRGQIPL